MKKLVNKKSYLYIILLIISVSLFSLNFFTVGFDYFWHFSAGRYMNSTGKILVHDVFSWLLKGKSWFSHEWLFEIFIYKLYKVFGEVSPLIYTFFSVFVLEIILFLTNKKSYLKNLLFTFWWIILSFIICFFMSPRPHLVSYSLISLTVYLLYDLYNREDSRKIYFLPIIGIIWSNFHGGSSNLLYILILIFIIGSNFKFKLSKIESYGLSKRQLNKYLFVLVLSIISICLNPQGFKMLLYPYINMKNTFMIKTLSEWQPTNFTNMNSFIFGFIFIFIIFTYLISDKKIKFTDLILYGFCLFLGLKSIRFWPFIYIISTYNVFYYVKSCNYEKYFRNVSILVSILIIILCFIRIDVIKNSVDEKILSDKAIIYLKETKPKRLFNYYDYGGYLIYENIDVFVDGRCDLYSDYYYTDYYNISTLNKDFKSLINKYRFDYYIIPSDIGLNYYLLDNSKYELVYQDSKTNIYKYLNE